MMSLDELAILHDTDKSSLWHGYTTSAYPNWLGSLKDRQIRLLELGVFRGGSMRMWDAYFTHPGTRLYGVDIDLGYVKARDFSDRVHLRQHDAVDASSWPGLELDVIIDDGSHRCADIVASCGAWWPYLKPGGLYIVEDTHTSYLEDYADGVYTTMDFLKALADEVNFVTMGTVRFPTSARLGFDVSEVSFRPDICMVRKAE